MEYRVKRRDEGRDAIEHGLFGNKGGAKLGSTWDNHLYIARQKVANGWRYFYDEAELRAAQAKQAGRKAANAVSNSRVGQAAQNAGRKIQSSTNQTIRRINNSKYGDAARSVKAKASNAYNKVKDVATGRYDDKVDDKFNQSSRDVTNEYNYGNGRKPDKATEITDKDLYNEAWKESQSAAYKISKGVDAAKETASKAKETISTGIHKTLSSVKESTARGKDFMDRAINSGKDKATSVMDKARDTAKRAVNDAKDTAESTVNNIKKAANDFRDYHDKIDNMTRMAKYNPGKQEVAKAAESSGKYKASKVIDKALDAGEKIGKNVLDKAEEQYYERRRDVEELTDKVKNYVTDKKYRTDKNYRDMTNGISSMKQDLKSVDAYIEELRSMPQTKETRLEISQNLALKNEIKSTLKFVEDELDRYSRGN